MKKLWLQSDRVCLAMGNSVALNLMFESKKDHELFFKYWKKYLGGMASLVNYHLTPTGWVLMFRTKSPEEIESAYLRQRSKSKKIKEENTLKDVSRMLSEHFRIFLSQFVRRTNAKHHRKGTKVMQRFHRYVFNETADYEHFFERITRQTRSRPQNRMKYQADETKYDILNQLGEESIWKVGTRMYKGFEESFRRRFGVLLLPPKSPVLRKYLSISKTQIFHPPHT